MTAPAGELMITGKIRRLRFTVAAVSGSEASRKLPGAWVPKNLLAADEGGGLDYMGFAKEKKPRWRR